MRVLSTRAGVPDRVGTIVGVLGAGGPPYRVRFDRGPETILTPTGGVVIEPGPLR